MLLAYWQSWSFFKARLISDYKSLLASFNPEFSFQYSFSSTVGERRNWDVIVSNWLHFLGPPLHALEGRASHAIGCQPLSRSGRRVCVPLCPLQRGREAIPCPPCSPLALPTGNLKVGTIAAENTASSSVDINFRCVLVATKFSLIPMLALLGS